MNPDPDRPFIGTGFRVTLSDVVSNLRQAAATKKGFMADKWKPSVIIRVADFPDMSKEGRPDQSSTNTWGQPRRASRGSFLLT